MQRRRPRRARRQHEEPRRDVGAGGPSSRPRVSTRRTSRWPSRWRSLVGGPQLPGRCRCCCFGTGDGRRPGRLSLEANHTWDQPRPGKGRYLPTTIVRTSRLANGAWLPDAIPEGSACPCVAAVPRQLAAGRGHAVSLGVSHWRGKASKPRYRRYHTMKLIRVHEKICQLLLYNIY